VLLFLLFALLLALLFTLFWFQVSMHIMVTVIDTGCPFSAQFLSPKSNVRSPSMYSDNVSSGILRSCGMCM
jgi:hypothetical protein